LGLHKAGAHGDREATIGSPAEHQESGQRREAQAHDCASLETDQNRFGEAGREIRAAWTIAAWTMTI
jgi:hypothetical protein